MSLAASRRATSELAEFSSATQWEDLPAPVLKHTRDLILDSVGCAMPGIFVEKGSIPVSVVKRFGGTAEATVIGSTLRIPTPFAAFANGELINALDFDAILAPGHVTPYVIPPALALGEWRHVSGADAILAIALSHEIGCRVANALDGLRQLRGKPPTLQLSPASGYGSTIFGAAAGAGKILKFDPIQMASMFGLAGYAAPVPSLTKYLKAPHSFHAKYSSAGTVAMTATMNALICSEGYLGDDEVLDGRYGFWRMFASKHCDWSFMLDGLGSEWRMLKAELKPFPAFRMSHPALEALQELITTEKIEPDAITRITVSADPVSLSRCYVNRRIGNHTDAQLSWPYLISAACYYEAGAEWQTVAIQDARVTELMRRVKMVPSSGWAQELDDRLSSGAATEKFPEWQRPEIELEAGGRTFRAKLVTQTKGSAANPMTREEIDRKFLRNATATIGGERAEEALQLLLHLEELDDLSALFEMVALR